MSKRFRARAAMAALLAVTVVGCGASVSDDVASDDAAITAAAPLSGNVPAGTMVTTTARVNLRSAPKIDDNVLDLVERNTTLEAVGGDAQNGFYAVKYGASQGFVSAKYLVRQGGSVSKSTEPPSASGFSVAYIGDSHSDYEGNARGSFGFLGQRLTELMDQQGIPLALFAASGSVPNWWFDDTAKRAATYGYTQTSSSPVRQSCSSGGKSGTCVPKLGAILKSHPSLFVIEQGTNLLGRSSSDIKNQIATTLAQIDGKADACLWIGAPSARTDVHSKASQDALWKLIRDNASVKCFVYDSRFLPTSDGNGNLATDANGDPVFDTPLAYSPDANNDGEHLGMTAAGKWADGVAKMIAFVRAHPKR